MNRKLEIENEEAENEIQNEIKLEEKNWHKCLHCRHWHSTKMK